MNSVVPVNQARRHLEELINQAHYQGTPFLLTKGKAMATLVGTKIFTQMLALVEKYDPGLADTLAVMSNPEIQAILEAGDKDIKEGKVRPFDTSLLDR
jgi:hypothetical protein